ncbi:hypothetical protein [Brevundimonas sp. SL161]|uniref:hypothetical protein n=1 Tax=Brevundimonas sp. SL161 TaxID=2804613 RepID=UPI003CE7E8EF
MTPYYRFDDIPDRHRLDLLLPQQKIYGKKSGFESEEQSAAEDIERVRLLEVTNRKEALALACRLGGERTPQTMASSRFMREARLRFGASILDGLEPWPKEHIRLVTQLPRSGEVRAKHLIDQNPRDHLERLRQQINRTDPGDGSGLLISVLEAELEPNSGVLRFHTHGVATGSYINRLRELHDLGAYKARAQVAKPLQLNRINDDDSRARVFSYLLKSFWKKRWIGSVGDDSAVKRERELHRLDEPYHTDMLLWLDRHSMSNISLYMGCRMRNSKIVLTDPQLSAPYMTRTLT